MTASHIIALEASGIELDCARSRGKLTEPPARMQARCHLEHSGLVGSKPLIQPEAGDETLKFWNRSAKQPLRHLLEQLDAIGYLKSRLQGHRIDARPGPTAVEKLSSAMEH